MTAQSDSRPPDLAKRDAILAEAIRVFADEGFRNADVQAIADRAGVGKGTVYRYFGNKENLFRAASLDVFSRLVQELILAITKPKDPVDQLLAAARAYARFYEAHSEYIELTVQERAEFRGALSDIQRQQHDLARARLGSILEDGIRQGKIRPINVRKVIHVLVGLLHGSLVQSCYHANELSLSETMEAAIEILLHGILAAEPPGEAAKPS